MTGKLVENDLQNLIFKQVLEFCRLLHSLHDAVIDDELDFVAIYPVIVADLHEEERDHIS